jgi:histone-lysine N-methyltransferase SETMAR
MLCIWWNVERIIHYELLERNVTVSAERYCQQLRRLKEANPAKTPGSTTWSDFSAWQRPTTHCKHDESGQSGTDWENPPYSPDLVQSDYHLFRALSNNLRGVSFNDSGLQNWLDEFFTAKPADFLKRVIENLPERWDAVVSNGGEYINDWLFDYLCEKINYLKNRTNVCTNPILALGKRRVWISGGTPDVLTEDFRGFLIPARKMSG